MKINEHLQKAYKKNTSQKQQAESPASSGKTMKRFEKTAVNSAEFLRLINQADPKERPSLREIAGFLLLMGTDEASKILTLLPEDLVEKISLEISRIKVLQPDESREIIARFHLAATEEKRRLRGGKQFAQELLEKSLGETRAAEILDRIIVPASFDQLDFLNELEPAQLKHLLAEEPPRLIGIILSHLEPKLGADLLQSIPSEIKPQIIQTMRDRVRLSQETLHSIVKSLKKKIRRIGTHQSEVLDGAQIVADILRNMNASAEREILEELGIEAPDIQAQIRERLFTIEQVLHIRDSDFQRILAEMSDDEIALLMKGKNEEIRLRFLNSVSSQRAIAISETYHFMGPVPRKDVDETNTKFIGRIRVLDEKGEIIIYRDDDAMVE